jgi:hypothetical protein
MKLLKVFIFVSIYALFACSETALILTEAHALDVQVISTVTSTYCKLPFSARMINRDRWNTAIAPNSIKLTCAVDKI